MAKLTLSHFQHLFSQASLRPEEAQIEPALLETILPGGSLTSDRAIDVYRTGHIVRLTEALGETFEAVWWVAGDDHYFRLAKEYLLTHPSTSYNLSDFGQTFPDFLEKKQPFSDLPFVSDLARFEWTFKEVFHLPTHTSLSPEDFQRQELSGEARLTFGASIRLFHSSYSIYEIWKLRGTEQESLPEEQWNTPQWLLCYKHQQQVYIKHVNQPEYLLLQHLHSGKNIEDALTQALEDYPDLNTTIVTDLFGLIKATGIATRLSTNAEA